MHNIALLLDTG